MVFDKLQYFVKQWSAVLPCVVHCDIAALFWNHFCPQHSLSCFVDVGGCVCGALTSTCMIFVCLWCVRLRGQKEEEPDVVLVKVEEVESASGPQTGLSIQEGEWKHTSLLMIMN